MASDIFRELNMDDFVSSDVIYSMREQMTPSDDVVNSLLAKIAALDAAPADGDGSVGDAEVLSFTPSSFDTETASPSPAYAQVTGNKHEKKSRSIGANRSAFKYATLAAGLAIMISALAIAGGGTGNVKDIVDNVLPSDVVTEPSDNGEDVQTPTDQAGDDQTSDDAVAGDDQTAGDDQATDKTDKTSDKASATTDSNKQVNKNGTGNTSSAPLPDDSTSVGKNTTGDISFSREILAEESVSHIAVSGTNYVVDTSATSAATTSKIETLSLDIPETSTTNETTVNAEVKKLKDVSTDLMVAVDVDGFKETLIYTNESYVPSSLGQFTSDLGLDSSNVSYSTAVYCKGSNIGYSSYHKFSVEDIQEYVDNYVLVNESAPCSSYRLYEKADTHVTFKSPNNPTGQTINMGVSGNGYLYVKLASGKSFTFYIGYDSAQSFIKAITE